MRSSNESMSHIKSRIHLARLARLRFNRRATRHTNQASQIACARFKGELTASAQLLRGDTTDGFRNLSPTQSHAQQQQSEAHHFPHGFGRDVRLPIERVLCNQRAEVRSKPS